MLYAPSAIGGHVDHLLVRDAALALGDRLGIPVWLYAELPYAVRFGWPGWVTGEPPGPADADWDHWLRDAPVWPSPDTAEVRQLGDEEMSAKLAAMRRYRTQFPLLNQGVIGLLEHPAVLPWEVMWPAGVDSRA
jgi:LmbE family N-acetylglucosaminyl deacetylase